jgi:hypothetical protein
MAARVFFHPHLSVIKVLTGKRLIAHQEAFSDVPIKDMGHNDIIGVKHFCSSQTNHAVARNKTRRQTRRNCYADYIVPLQYFREVVAFAIHTLVDDDRP